MLISFLWDHLNSAVSQSVSSPEGRRAVGGACSLLVQQKPQGCACGLLGVWTWPTGTLRAVSRGLSCGKAAGAWTSSFVHRVCGYPGKGEGPLKMCCRDMKTAGGGDFFQFLFFFITSRDDLEMGRYGTSFMYPFSMYLIATCCGPGTKPHCAYGVNRKRCPCPDPAVKVRKSLLLAVGAGGGMVTLTILFCCRENCFQQGFRAWEVSPGTAYAMARPRGGRRN